MTKDIAKVNTVQKRCQRCGYYYSEVWQTSDEVWRKVTEIEDGSGLFCISCFTILARSQGISLSWECTEGVFPGRHHPFSRLDTSSESVV